MYIHITKINAVAASFCYLFSKVLFDKLNETQQQRPKTRVNSASFWHLFGFAICTRQVQAEHAKAKGAELRKTPPHTDLPTVTNSSMHF